MHNALSLNNDKTKFTLLHKLIKSDHCVKSVRIRSFSGLYFPTFGLNTERYFVLSPNVGKYGPEKLRIRTLFTQRLIFC